MIRWCAYCQRFLGEAAPFDDLSVTHGICRGCVAEEKLLTGASDQVVAIAEFFHNFVNDAIHGPLPDPIEVVEAGYKLGIAPVDLLLGIAQPTLHAIGHLFAAGQVSSEREHKLSLRIETILAAFEEAAPRRDDAPQMLLVSSRGNRHHIGMRVFALVLVEADLGVDILASASAATLEATLASRRYDCVGFSAALPQQFRSASELAQLAKRVQPDIVTALGGYATKDPVADGHSFDVIADPHSSRDTARRLVEALTGSSRPPAQG